MSQDVSSRFRQAPLRVLMAGPLISHVQRGIQLAQQAGAQVAYIGAAPPPPTWPQCVQFIPYQSLSQQQRELTVQDWSSYDHFVKLEKPALQAALAEYRPHLVHTFGLLFDAGLCAAAGTHPLVISSLSDFEDLFFPDHIRPRPEWQARKRAILEAADALLVEAPAQAERLAPLLAAPARLEACTMAVDARLFRRAGEDQVLRWRRALGLPAQALVLLSPRGWSWSYNHHLILEAFARLRAQLPRPAVLVFLHMPRHSSLSQTEQYYHAVQELALRLGVAEAIRWLPAFPSEMMPALYNVADLVINYRTPDSYPSTVLEALACERPVIVPELPTLRGSLIEQYALLVQPNNVPALAEKILANLADPPRAAWLERARQAVVAEYDQPVVRQKLLRLYNELV